MMQDLISVLLLGMCFFNTAANIALTVACIRMARRLKRLEGQ